MKIVNGSADVVQGDLYEIIGEDGLLVVFDYYVMAKGEDGNEYVHNISFKGWGEDQEGIAGINYGAEADAEKLKDRVNAKGVINLDHWEMIQPAPSYALGEVPEELLMDEEERFVKGC